MGQSSSAEHQCGGYEEHVLGTALAFCVGCKAKLFAKAIESIQQVTAAIGLGEFRAETNLRYGLSGHHDGDEYRRDHESEDQNTVLSNLSVSDAFHAT